MDNLKKAILDLLNNNAVVSYGRGSCGELADASNVLEGEDFSYIADEIISMISKDYRLLKENDFDSTIVEKGYYYLVKFKSGNYGEVWYNCHGQWMYQFKGVEDSIDKIYTPKIK